MNGLQTERPPECHALSAVVQRAPNALPVRDHERGVDDIKCIRATIEQFEGGHWKSRTTCCSGGETSSPGYGNSCQPRDGDLLVRRCGGGGRHVFRIEMSNPLTPHFDERPRCQLIHRFPRVFDGRKGIPPYRAFAPSFAFLHAFAGGTHGFPSDAIRLADVLGGAFPALLMDQVKIAQGRLLVRHPLEQNAFGNDLVGGRNGIVAGIYESAPSRIC